MQCGGVGVRAKFCGWNDKNDKSKCSAGLGLIDSTNVRVSVE